MIVEIPDHIHKLMIEKIRLVNCKPTDYNRLLTIGRIYHTLSLVTEENQAQDTVVICVQHFKPQYNLVFYLRNNLISFYRYLFQPKPVHYKYRFQCPDSSTYDPANYELQLESLESFPWSIVDNVVCSHGTGDHKLSDVCIKIYLRSVFDSIFV